jgi:O-glycosyl hydrolase
MIFRALRFSLFFLLGSMMSLSMMAQDRVCYLVHNSGKVLGIGAENRAVILSPDDASLTKLCLSKQTDGTYLISIDKNGSTLYLSLGTSNNWSTYFVTNSEDPRAHYTLEESGSYVKLKNMQTNGYLGTDETNAGAYVYSDKNGTDNKHRWKLSDTPVVEEVVETVCYPVSADAKRQTVEGWGVSLCWWANMCGKWSDTKIDQLIDWMVSPEGLNWNIFRYNIGGGDDPLWTNCTEHHMGNGKGLRAEMEGFQMERGGEYLWDRDAAQRKIMLKIREKRPDAIFEAFSNSCPWWMTVSGCCAGSEGGGSDNLKTDYYEDFAHYLVDVCKHYKDEYGIEFKTLEPFNESVTGFWYRSGVQEGCHFDYSSQANFVKVLAPILAESGLNTVISASDETNVGLACEGIRQFKSQNALDLIAQCNTHTYSGDNRNRSQYGSLGRSNGKIVWMSETGSGGSGLGGNLSMAQRLIDDVRYIAPSAWVDWQYMEENNDQWCMVRGSFANATFSKVKNFYVRQQFTRFIKQGYSIVESLNDHSLAAVNPERDTLVLVMLNTDSKVIHKVSMPMIGIDGTIKAWRTSENENLKSVTGNCTVVDENTIEVVLPEASITTLVIPMEMMVEETPLLSEGDTYMIIPQSNVNNAVALTNNGLTIQPADLNDEAQLWNIVKRSNGSYWIKNSNGNYVQSSSSYALSCSNSTSTSGRNFTIDFIDDIHCRISVTGDAGLRSWDLDNQSLNAGTRVGVWQYGNAADADHRNWFLMRVGSTHEKATSIAEVKRSDEEMPEAIYSLSGVRMKSLQRGVNIVRRNGKFIKVVK